jgi:LmbE family N-acetylglucosaminyl deacetylase
MPSTTESAQLFASSVLVVAHPDDEILWFSSILAHVSKIIICYEDCADMPESGPGRRAVMQAYPLSNVTWLRKPEPCTVQKVDWKQPIATDYGMALNAHPPDPAADERYRAAHALLSAELGEALRGAANVYTHNPWGEYGHPDHVQVSRIVVTLAAQLGCTARFSSYIAPRSMSFAAQFLPRMKADFRRPTDRVLAAGIKSLYQEHHCWTWDRSYEPPIDEAFLRDTGAPLSEAHGLPLNCLMTV